MVHRTLGALPRVMDNLSASKYGTDGEKNDDLFQYVRAIMTASEGNMRNILFIE